MDELNKHISEIEQEILRLSDKYKTALNLIRTVPGFDKNPLTAIQVLSEILSHSFSSDTVGMKSDFTVAAQNFCQILSKKMSKVR